MYVVQGTGSAAWTLRRGLACNELPPTVVWVALPLALALMNPRAVFGCPRCFFRSGSTATQASGAQGHQVANPPQQAAARKQSKHTEGRKLPGLRKANTLLPPAACCRRQPFPGPILGRPPQAPGLCLDSLLEGLGGEREEADPGPCLLRLHLVP